MWNLGYMHLNLKVLYPLFCDENMEKSVVFLFWFDTAKNVTFSIVSFVLYGDINYVSVEEIAYHNMANIFHYSDVMMGAMAPQIMSITIVYSTVYSGADQGKYEWSASLAFVRGIYWWPLNSPHKWPVTRKMFPFDDVIIHRMDPPTPTPSPNKTNDSITPQNWNTIKPRTYIRGTFQH